MIKQLALFMDLFALRTEVMGPPPAGSWPCSLPPGCPGNTVSA